MDELPEISGEELEERVLYSVLRAAARMASRFGLELEPVRQLFDMARYHELKVGGLTLEEAAQELGVSRRKAAQLSKTLKQNFFRPESEHGLPRRIEFMLWAGPMTEGRIVQSVEEASEEAILEALELLVAQERVLCKGGRPPVYEVPRHQFRLYRDNWMAKIDGLNNLLGNMTNAIYARFFHNHPDSFARTLNFRIRREDVPRLKALYEEVLWETLRRLDEEAHDDDGALRMDLSILWAPADFMDQHDAENGARDE